MTSPALRLVIEPHHLKHSSNISLLIARHTFEWKRVRLSVEPEPLEKEGEALRLVIEPHHLKHSSNISLLIARHTFEESFHQWKWARLSEPEPQEKEGEARVSEPESEEGVPEEGEARAELPSFGLATMGKSPDVGRPRRPLVSRKKLTIPDLCLFDKKGRVLFVIEVCIILPASFSYFQSPMHIYTDENAPK